MKDSAPCLAVLGTGSDVGKSVITTALCRVFSDRGYRTAPFKSQNMSNNSGVTAEGLEMGRAQIVQAEAARTAPLVDMNPVLLKPTSDMGSQVVLLGQAAFDSSARDYQRRKGVLSETAWQALERLRRRHDLVIMEGAGSCAEVNLLENDFVNLPLAARAQAPAVLVADIHRGGVFAQIVGTLACLPAELRTWIRGFIINRFRGDLEVFWDGVSWLEERTGLPVFGVMPWFRDFEIEAEDSMVIEQPVPAASFRPDRPTVAVIRLPHISNFTDMAPLGRIPGLQLAYLETPQKLDRFAAVILPGSKNTRADLEWMSARGWFAHLLDYREGGGCLLGICGGYQMLGAAVQDPEGWEDRPGTTAGLGLLPVETVLQAPKTTTLTAFSWEGAPGTGYEIHMGCTERTGGRPLFAIHRRNQTVIADVDGCLSDDGRVMGTYMHGLFDTPAVTRRWLASIGLRDLPVPEVNGPAMRDAAYDQLAALFTERVDVEAISRLLPGLKA